MLWFKVMNTTFISEPVVLKLSGSKVFNLNFKFENGLLLRKKVKRCILSKKQTKKYKNE